MTGRVLHGEAGRWAGRAWRHGRGALALATRGLGRTLGIAPRARRGGGRHGGPVPRDRSPILHVMPGSVHRRRPSAHGIAVRHAAQHAHAAPHAGARWVHARRRVMPAGTDAVRHARAHAGMAVRGHGRRGAQRAHLDASHGRHHGFAHLPHPHLSRRSGGTKVLGLRSSRVARPDHSLAPRARGGSGAVSTEAMRREVARRAAEALRREDGHLDHAMRTRNGAGHAMTAAASAHAEPVRQKDPGGALPAHLRDEVRHALEVMRGGSREGMRRLFADESRRPPSGVTGFDHRLAPIWAGRKPAF